MPFYNFGIPFRLYFPPNSIQRDILEATPSQEFPSKLKGEVWLISELYKYLLSMFIPKQKTNNSLCIKCESLRFHKSSRLGENFA